MRTNQFLASSVGLVATVSAQTSSQGSYQASGIPICAQHTATGTAEVAASRAIGFIWFVFDAKQVGAP